MVDAFKVCPLSAIVSVEIKSRCQPDYIAPLVGYLTSAGECSILLCYLYLVHESLLPENSDTSGGLFEVLGGWAAQTRWQRAGGYGFPTNKPLTPEDIASKWNIITNFSRRSSCASNTQTH
jgi:multifunctional beta-oxidation protein